MQPEILIPDFGIQHIVKHIFIFEEVVDGKTVLPFYADGYPGIMLHLTKTGLYVKPQDKSMPDFFLYGQTIHPIELSMEGPYKLIAFQLYPDVVGQLLDIQPKDINDACFDLSTLPYYKMNPIIPAVRKSKETNKQVEIITAFLSGIAKMKPGSTEDKIRRAIQLILKSRGSASIKDLRAVLYITERTFERRFTSQVGISPKQFAKIIRFQHSLEEVSDHKLDKLTDVAYDHLFTDQSHFIKAFKEYTGKTPKEFRAGAK